MSLYEEIMSIMNEELPGIGMYILKKQMRNLGIEEEALSPEDIPRVSRAVAEASTMFGKEKARVISRRIEKIAKVGTIIKEEKDPVKKLDMLMDIGKARYSGGEWNEAMKNFLEALKISRSSNIPKMSGEILIYLGNIKIRMGDFKGAEKDFEEAKEIFERIFDKRGIADAINGLGSLEWRRGNYRKAIKHLEKVRRMGEDMGDDRLIGKAYMGIANVYDEMGNQEEGIYNSELALKYLEKTGDKKGIVTIYNNMGVTYARMADMDGDMKAYEKSRGYYEKCIELAKELDYVVMEGWASFNLAETLAKMGKFDEAIKTAEHSMQIFEKLGDKLGLSGALMSFAVIYREKGDYEKAKDYFERTIKLRRELRTPYRIADALYEYGLMLMKINDKEAKKALEEAAKIFEEIGNKERAEDARTAMKK